MFWECICAYVHSGNVFICLESYNLIFLEIGRRGPAFRANSRAIFSFMTETWNKDQRYTEKKLNVAQG